MVPRSVSGGLLSRDPAFRSFYYARALSLVGDGLVPVALAFAVIEVDPAASALGSVLAARSATLVITLLVGGALADRVDRIRLMVASDLLRLGAQAVTAAALLTEHATVVGLAVLAGVYGVGEGLFLPAATGALPDVVSPRHLQQANALLAMTMSASGVLGPAAAGVLIAVVGAGWAIAIDAATFAASAAFLVQLRAPHAAPRGSSRRSTLHDVAEGWQVFRSRTWLWVDGVFSALGNFAVLAPFLALGPIIAAQSLGGSSAWAMVMTGFGLGALSGALVLMRIRPTRPLLVAVPPLALLALPTALLAARAPVIAVTAAAFAAGAGLSVFNTLFETTVQQHVPSNALSRVAAIDWMLSTSLRPLGFAAAAFTASKVGPGPVLAAAACWIVVSTAAVVALPAVRAVQAEPAQDEGLCHGPDDAGPAPLDTGGSAIGA